MIEYALFLKKDDSGLYTVDDNGKIWFLDRFKCQDCSEGLYFVRGRVDKGNFGIIKGSYVKGLPTDIKPEYLSVPKKRVGNVWVYLFGNDDELSLLVDTGFSGFVEMAALSKSRKKALKLLFALKPSMKKVFCIDEIKTSADFIPFTDKDMGWFEYVIPYVEEYALSEVFLSEDGIIYFSMRGVADSLMYAIFNCNGKINVVEVDEKEVGGSEETWVDLSLSLYTMMIKNGIGVSDGSRGEGAVRYMKLGGNYMMYIYNKQYLSASDNVKNGVKSSLKEFMSMLNYWISTGVRIEKNRLNSVCIPEQALLGCYNYLNYLKLLKKGKENKEKGGVDDVKE